MNIQKNHSINVLENKQNYILRTIFLSIVGLMLAIFTAQVKAESIKTVVQMGENGHELTNGRVTVFDAGSGRQIANGVIVWTVNGSHDFVFSSTPDQDIVVVGITDSGLIGSKRGSTNQSIYIYASQPIATMPIVHADALLTYTDTFGAPVKKAIVTTTEWVSLGNARRGKTNNQGQYLFTDPKDLAGSDFLAVEWKGNGMVNLKAIVTGNHTIPGDDDPED
jgi:hypothetical protein